MMRERSRRPRWAVALAFATLMGCGARTELLGVSDAVQDDSGAPADAAQLDGTVPFDASNPQDAGSDDATPDASMVDGGADSAPIECVVQSTTSLAEVGVAELDQISLDDSYVYFHGDKGISRVAKSGGAVTSLATGKAPSWPDLYAFALDDTGVTWWQIKNGAMQTDVKRVPKQGGAPTIVATLSDYVGYGVAGPGGSTFAWNGVVLDSVTANGVIKQVGGTPFNTSAVAYSGGELYVLAQSGVYRWDGMVFQSLAATVNIYPVLMAFDDDTVFVVSNDLNSGFLVSSVPKLGGVLTTLLAVPTSYVGGITVDADHVWVANRVPGGGAPSALLRMNKDGTNVTSVATSATSQIVAVAVDDNCVYWTETTNSGKVPSRVVVSPK